MLTRWANLSNRLTNAEQNKDHCNSQKFLVCAKWHLFWRSNFEAGNFAFKAFSLPLRPLFAIAIEKCRLSLWLVWQSDLLFSQSNRGRCHNNSNFAMCSKPSIVVDSTVGISQEKCCWWVPDFVLKETL